jgi:hypothetical protein
MCRFAALLLSLLLPLQAVAGLVTSHHCLGHQDAATVTIMHSANHSQIDRSDHDCQGHDCLSPAETQSVTGGVCQNCVSCVSCSIAVSSYRIESTQTPQISPQADRPELLSGVIPRVETRPPIAS